MKKLGLLVTLAAGTVGAIALLQWLKKKSAPYHFMENWPNAKNFGEFPPEIPEGEFDGVDFFAEDTPASRTVKAGTAI